MKIRVMKRVFFLLTLTLSAVLSAQRDGAQPVTGSVVAKEVGDNGIRVGADNVLVGYSSGYIGSYQLPGVTVTENLPDPLVVFGFPYSVDYAFDTFASDGFEVSKGYFGDRIQLNWRILANKSDIERLQIFRRLYDSDEEWVQIASASAEALKYEDFLIGGNTLFEYKLQVVWKNPKVPNNTPLRGFITGKGFRSPTATVAGNISYDNGAPVKDVVVMAVPDGANGTGNTGLMVPSTSTASVVITKNKFTVPFTVEAHVKPVDGLSNGEVVQLFGVDAEEANKSLSFYVQRNGGSYKLYVKNKINQAYVWELNGYIPSGKVNPKGEDFFVPVSQLATGFNHIAFTVQETAASLLINGREVTEDYISENEQILKSQYGNTATMGITAAIENSSPSFDSLFNGLRIGGLPFGFGGAESKDLLIDEFRVWAGDAPRRPEFIRRDYKRFITGNDVGILAYYRFNIGIGDRGYDLANRDFTFYKNDLRLGEGVQWVTDPELLPSQDQLGVLGVTDENGSYTISGISYAGNGETFAITPIYGVHEFMPSQKKLFLGVGEEVVNNLNFTDISSFVFKGKVLVNTQEFFKPTFTDAANTIAGNLDTTWEGYNEYKIGNDVYTKGRYWAEEVNPDDATEVVLYPYFEVPVQGGSVYLDGNLMLDNNNQPVMTDKNGEFKIQVPIGEHYIEVRKNGHSFEHNGRFPAQATDADEPALSEFFEDREPFVYFLDNTTVDVVGRVVGGEIEAEKAIGFGHQGAFSHTIDAETEFPVSSKGNLGSATLVLALKGGGSTEEYQINTNGETGEYRVSVPPLNYEISKGGIVLTGQTLEFIKEDKVALDFTNAAKPKTHPKYGVPKPDGVGDVGNNQFDFFAIGNDDNPDTRTIPEEEFLASKVGAPYQFERSFIYYADPTVTLVHQTRESTIAIEGQEYQVNYGTSEDTPLVYKLGSNYEIAISRKEVYYNGSGLGGTETDLTTLDPKFIDEIDITRGRFLITNNFGTELAKPMNTAPSPDDKLFKYNYKVVQANNNGNFLQTIAIQYQVAEGAAPIAIAGFRSNAMVMGPSMAFGASFVTAGPEVPDIILRDPPGSASFAEIRQGSTFSVSKSYDEILDTSAGGSLTIHAGMDFSLAGGAVPTPTVELNSISDLTSGLTASRTQTDGNSQELTYTFNNAMRTSDDPDFVGADADLYIGTSTNQKVVKTQSVKPILGRENKYDGLTVSVKNGDVVGTENLFLDFDLNEAIAVSDMGSTLFIFTQRFILNELIPEYEDWITKINTFIETNNVNLATKDTPGITGLPVVQPEGDDSVNLTNEIIQYRATANNWKTIIRENERQKHLAFTTPEVLRGQIKSSMDRLADDFRDNDIGDGGLNAADDLRATLSRLRSENFKRNVSFDSGAGPITFETEAKTLVATTENLQAAWDIDASFVKGLAANGTGITLRGTSTISEDYVFNNVINNQERTIVSYTLFDPDELNSLSVDVYNLFDGNGPIFITKAGKTSCPWEGPTYAKFYHPNEGVNGTLMVNQSMQWRQLDPSTSGEEIILGDPTEALEMPNISATISQVLGVPVGKKASFDVSIRNDGSAQEGVFLELLLDESSNPNNAITNIPANGQLIFVEPKEVVNYTVTVEQGREDVFEYDSLRVILRSPCNLLDFNEDKQEASVTLNAGFVPSCSPVSITSPKPNWVKNIRNTVRNIGGTQRIDALPLQVNTSEIRLGSGAEVLLQYRLQGSATWNRLARYHTVEESFARDAQGRNPVLLENTGTEVFLWDIVQENLADGIYEVQVKSFCPITGTEFDSDVITGKIDLNSAQQFGTPTPTNGILNAGDDLMVTFNEDVSVGGAAKLDFRVQLNQLPISHQVSMVFDANSSGTVARPNFGTGDMTLQWWMNNQMATQQYSSLFYQSDDGFNVEVNQNKLKVSYNNKQVLEGDILDDSQFNFYTLTYSMATEAALVNGGQGEQQQGTLSLFVNGNVSQEVTLRGADLITWDNETPLQVGKGSGPLQMHDLRLWAKAFGLAEAFSSKSEVYTGSERQLLGYWPMSEGQGNLALDKARFKHMELNNPVWVIKPKGEAYVFDGTNDMLLRKLGSAVITDDMDATIVLWFRTTNANGTLLANGLGNTGDPVVSNGKRNKYRLFIEEGVLKLSAENLIFPFGQLPVNDGKWHHAAFTIKRDANMKMLLDGNVVATHSTASLGGLSNSLLYVGTRLRTGQPDMISDLDKDGIIDFYDNDKDGDGLLDNTPIEALLDPAPFTADMDEDGILDGDDHDIDGYGNFIRGTDFDGDGIKDSADLDMDGDGQLDADDDDDDGDGLADNLDPNDRLRDFDGDGILDGDDADIDNNPATIEVGGDLDGDGIKDESDDDRDGDGIANIDDADPDNDDSDGDNYPDYMDTDFLSNLEDEDGDTLANEYDVQFTKGTDIDSDGIDDFLDPVIGVGISNSKVEANRVTPDKDNDGIVDSADADDDGTDGTDVGKEDLDTDGIIDASDPDMDNDGILNDADADDDGIDGTDAGKEDLDNDGIIDAADPDMDNDGIPNSADADQDGIDGTDEGKLDTDGDGVTDDSDEDRNGNNIPDSFEIAFVKDGVDSNNDGIDDRIFAELSNTNVVYERDAQGKFVGEIDEIQIWNLARTNEQIKEDMFFEQNAFDTPGLIVYAPMNRASENSNLQTPPTFYRPTPNLVMLAERAVVTPRGGYYTTNGPAVKPFRRTDPLNVNYVLRENQIILQPDISNWASVEGKTATVTVSGLLDASGNLQASPVTWNVFVDKNPVKWFAEGFDDVVSLKQNFNEESTFEIKVINSGPNALPYSVENIPEWLKLAPSSGNIAPNSTITLQGTVNAETKVGEFEHDLFLDSGYGLDDKITLNLRVLKGEPQWTANPDAFQYSMSLIGKISIEGLLSDDIFDIVTAKVNGEVRGTGKVTYDEDFDEYFVYLTFYSNTTSGEKVTFQIWDASQGLIKDGLANGEASIPFVNNQIIGSQVVPVLFSSTAELFQIESFNRGWNWFALHVKNDTISDISDLFSRFDLTDEDRVVLRKTEVNVGAPLSSSAHFSSYENENWLNNLSLTAPHTLMYQIRLARAQDVEFKGSSILLADTPLQLAKNWNYLPYLGNSVISVNEALANLDVANGDLVKSQSRFAIYNNLQGWKGSLTAMQPGEGYMLKINSDQSAFRYPNISNAASKTVFQKQSLERKEAVEDVFADYPMNMNMVVSLPAGSKAETIEWRTEEGVLRGSTTVVPNTENQYFMTVYGEAKEKLICTLLEQGNTIETINIISFEANALLGSLEEPYAIVLPVKKESQVGIVQNDLVIAPNPFETDVVLYINAKEAAALRIAILGLNGQLMFQKEYKATKGRNEVSIRPAIASGVYLLQIELGSSYWTKKIIKK